MKLKTLTAAILIATLSLVSTTSVLSQPNRRANSFAPGFWQPKAEINPNRPILIRLLNQSGMPIRYGLSGGIERVLPAGSTTDVYVGISDRTRDIANLNIYAGDEVMFDYNVSNSNVVPPNTNAPRINSNLLQVLIRSAGTTKRADKAVYIDETGRVYSF